MVILLAFKDVGAAQGGGKVMKLEVANELVSVVQFDINLQS